MPDLDITGQIRSIIHTGSGYVDPGAVCSGYHDGESVGMNSTGTVDPSTSGTYTVTYECMDGHGLYATDTRTVVVIDENTPPEIHVTYQRPSIPRSGGDYSSDAICIDREDGNISNLVTSSVSFSGDAATITYSYTDSYGTTATTSRAAKVLGDAPPTLVMRGQSGASVLEGSPWSDPGAYCTDDKDGTFDAFSRGTVDTSTLGTYSISYMCVDSSGHSDGTVRTVTVKPAATNLYPVLLLSSDEVHTGVGGSFSLPSATCTDHEDGSLPYEVDSDDIHGVDTSRPGVYWVVYYENSAGNLSVDAVAINVNP